MLLKSTFRLYLINNYVQYIKYYITHIQVSIELPHISQSAHHIIYYTVIVKRITHFKNIVIKLFTC